MAQEGEEGALIDCFGSLLKQHHRPAYGRNMKRKCFSLVYVILRTETIMLQNA